MRHNTLVGSSIRRNETIKIISFEGADYVGKTTTAKYLADFLRSDHPEIVYNNGTIHQSEELTRLGALASQSDNLTRERIYSAMFATDKQHDVVADPRIILQDRYWMSVVAYGRFLNGHASMHHNADHSASFVQPDAVVYLTCTFDERIRRSSLRLRQSVLDKFFLSDPTAMRRLEQEIEVSLQGLSVITIDTTTLSIPDVAYSVLEKLDEGGIVCGPLTTSSVKAGTDSTRARYN